MIQLSLIIIAGYVIGSIPTALLISRKFFGIDIREKGSGNSGSTNAFRVLGWKAGLAVQVIDILKGVVAVVVASLIYNGVLPFNNRTPFEDITLIRSIGGAAAVLGHIYSMFAGFRGGKGINAAFGVVISIAPVDTGVATVIFLLVVFTSGYISLGSITAAFALPTTMFVRYNVFHAYIEHYHTMVLVFTGLSLLLIFAHRSNIDRLLRGTERRFQTLRLFRRH
jgi:glycerol-3-phosphate acyltransferase PlsY